MASTSDNLPVDEEHDEAKFKETLKRMIQTPPKPHKKDAGPKPDASRLRVESSHNGSEPVKDGGKAE